MKQIITIIAGLFLGLCACSAPNTSTTNSMMTNTVNHNLNVSNNNGNEIGVKNLSANNSSAANAQPSANKPIGKLDPYTGSLADLLPEQITNGKETWKRVAMPESDNSFAGFGPEEGLAVDYGLLPLENNAYKKQIYIIVGNCASVNEANAGMEKTMRQNKSPLVPKMKNGRTVGKEAATSDGTATVWTDGSVMISLVATKDSKKEDLKRFADMLPY